MSKTPYDLFFSTLGNQTRLAILHALMKGPKNVTRLTKELGFDQTTVSHNLRRLTICGFVHKNKNGRYRVYSLNRETILPLLKLIDRHTDKYCKRLCE